MSNILNNKVFYSNNLIIQNITSIFTHIAGINSASTFPSGNIISVSDDQSIIIYDSINFNIIQHIQNAHDDWIKYVEFKDENNFVTCSWDKNIKLWRKKDNKFQIHKTIKKAHDDTINKVIYFSNENLISCSTDKTIKIWKENNKNCFENIKTLTHSDYIGSLLYLEDKNILISSGGDGTKFWNLKKNETDFNNINLSKSFQGTDCDLYGQLCRLNEDIIIVKGDNTPLLKLISISKKEIIKEIDNEFDCYGICLIKNKGIFLVGGWGKNIRVYRNDTYDYIQTIYNAHNEWIYGFIDLKNGKFASFSVDNKIRIWSFLNDQ